MNIVQILMIPLFFSLVAIAIGEIIYLWGNPAEKKPKPINMTKAPERLSSVAPVSSRPSNGGYKGRGYGSTTSISSKSTSDSGWGFGGFDSDSGGCSGSDSGCSGGDD
jgi:uncharacterized membrane protein YgcG